MKKIKETMKNHRINRWVTLCVIVLAIAAIVVAIFLLRIPEDGDEPLVFPPTEPAAAETAPPAQTRTPPKPAPTAAPEATPAPTETPATPEPTMTPSPAITPPAASAPPASGTDITLYPVDPPAVVNLE